MFTYFAKEIDQSVSFYMYKNIFIYFINQNFLPSLESLKREKPGVDPINRIE